MQIEPVLPVLFKAIASNDDVTTHELLHDFPDIARQAFPGKRAKSGMQEHFLPEIQLNIYAGDTALHVAAAAYRTDLAREFIDRGALICAQNRRGAQPIHSATVGSPGSHHWNPNAQIEIIAFLISAGANPDAVDKSGVTPLHRAIRNRCSAAVKTLLEAGADYARKNDNGSSAMLLATQTTGRGGTGSEAAKLEQSEIIRLLGTCPTS